MADLMKHQSGNEAVRANEHSTWKVGGPSRLAQCRVVSGSGIPTLRRFFIPVPEWVATANPPRKC